MANAVEQPAAKSVLNVGSGPSPHCFGWFVKVRPPTSLLAMHGICVLMLKPSPISAAVETRLKAWPGRYAPFSGLTSGIRWPWWVATARIRPVEGSTATSAAEVCSDLTAWVAASCTPESIVVRTGCPG